MKPDSPQLSRREREIMEVIHALREASATEIREKLTEPPANAAVRNHLRILEEKGHLKRRKQGKKFIYRATASKLKTGRNAISRVISVYFGDSLQKAVAAHIADPAAAVSEDELDALESLIEQARNRKSGKNSNSKGTGK